MNNFDEYENNDEQALNTVENNAPTKENTPSVATSSTANNAQDGVIASPFETQSQPSSETNNVQHVTHADLNEQNTTEFTMVSNEDQPQTTSAAFDTTATEQTTTGFTMVSDDDQQQPTPSTSHTEDVSSQQLNDTQQEILQAEEIQFEQIEPETEETNTDSNNGKKKKRMNAKHAIPFMKQHQRSSIMASCFVLALAGGFGGTLAAQYIGKHTGSGGTVLYQSVTNANATNTSSTSTGNMSVKEVASAVSNSVVEIKTESVSTNSFFQQAVQSGAGSGVILSADGYVVTNNHVIEGANKISVTTKDGTSYEATLIGTDSTTDLAVLKIEASDLTPAVLGTSGNLEVGDTAIAIGNPLGELGGTVTSGIISALDRAITIDNQEMHLLQTSAAINPGNSGGGLFNDQGELIGVVNAKSSGESIEGLGFAIPIDRAKDIIENLIENGYVKGRAALGVSLTEGTNSNPFSTSNTVQVFIAQVESGKAADNAGLQVGDQILKVDDQEVESMADVKTAISSHTAGDKITMVILRKSETKTVEVTLGEASTTTSNNATTNGSNNSESNGNANGNSNGSSNQQGSIFNH